MTAECKIQGKETKAGDLKTSGSSADIDEIIKASVRFKRQIERSGLDNHDDLGMTSAAIGLMQSTKLPGIPENAINEMLNGAYWLILCVNTDKYSLARVCDDPKHVEATLRNSILGSLDDI